MVRVPWTDEVSYEEMLRRAGVSRKILKDIRMRQLSFMGHAIRKRGLENLVLTGKTGGKRSSWRRWQLWTANLVEWIKERGVNNFTEMELLIKANDREL